MMFVTSGGAPGANTPITSWDTYAVTPSDTVDLPSASGNNRPCAGLQVTGSGNVAVNLAGGGTATLTGLAAGQRLPIAITRILATGTTATGILALY